mmetsp:Transcript_48021/g.102897  ORF Transcript_48021/g.102897 Transcript_48021/m.102897 type:complete len:233 (+) Transcript_48021:265-963(+)
MVGAAAVWYAASKAQSRHEGHRSLEMLAPIIRAGGQSERDEENGSLLAFQCKSACTSLLAIGHCHQGLKLVSEFVSLVISQVSCGKQEDILVGLKFVVSILPSWCKFLQNLQQDLAIRSKGFAGILEGNPMLFGCFQNNFLVVLELFRCNRQDSTILSHRSQHDIPVSLEFLARIIQCVPFFRDCFEDELLVTPKFWASKLQSVPTSLHGLENQLLVCPEFLAREFQGETIS